MAAPPGEAGGLRANMWATKWLQPDLHRVVVVTSDVETAQTSFSEAFISSQLSLRRLLIWVKLNHIDGKSDFELT